MTLVLNYRDLCGPAPFDLVKYLTERHAEQPANANLSAFGVLTQRNHFSSEAQS
jgi:hypothetical protein